MKHFLAEQKFVWTNLSLKETEIFQGRSQADFAKHESKLKQMACYGFTKLSEYNLEKRMLLCEEKTT